MRIIAGEARGRRLADVGAGDIAAHLRPTSDRVRESLFNVLAGAMGDPVPGALVLDLFAGTGALGLEALSRGAASARFVENGRVALGLLASNIALLKYTATAHVIRQDVRQMGPCAGAPATLVFVDPPYGQGLGEVALSAAIAGGWLAPGALVVWEENTPLRPPAGLRQCDMRRYGDTRITLFEWGG
ncbi:16S rRNA (guanine(966)-N(2))-methyltransferase RsmD [Rhodobacteraceae bacterium KMM 6894]|nr:16S rRNA (guanine(966)-N(2))-methyltransferase RsmD [Rhodobacteraceae bacterium KMM 6894]